MLYFSALKVPLESFLHLLFLFSFLILFSLLVEYVESIYHSSQQCFYPLLSYIIGRSLLQSCFPHACSTPCAPQGPSVPSELHPSEHPIWVPTCWAIRVLVSSLHLASLGKCSICWVSKQTAHPLRVINICVECLELPTAQHRVYNGRCYLIYRTILMECRQYTSRTINIRKYKRTGTGKGRDTGHSWSFGRVTILPL